MTISFTDDDGGNDNDVIPGNGKNKCGYKMHSKNLFQLFFNSAVPDYFFLLFLVAGRGNYCCRIGFQIMNQTICFIR